MDEIVEAVEAGEKMCLTDDRIVQLGMLGA